MKLRFTKMHGLGNDFVMIDAISQKIKLSAERARTIADRHFGIGCDQILIVEPPTQPDVDFKYRIFNQDGNEVENCGNGARCFAIFVRQRRLTGKQTITAETLGGNLTLEVQDDLQVKVNMGIPRLAPEAIPFNTTSESILYALAMGTGETLSIGAVSMGNPHAVLEVENVQDAPVNTLGSQIERHTDFPKRVNAGFMQIVNRQQIRLRVYERGVGETLACGTGACAAVVSGHIQNKLDHRVTVSLPGGDLDIDWAGPGQPVMMTGPVKTVFHGQIAL